MLQAFAAGDDKRWKCETCLLRMDEHLIKCKACESYRPGLSDAEIAAAKAKEEQRKQNDISIFRSATTTVPQTGFSGFATPAPTGFGTEGIFGSGSSSSSLPTFGFGSSVATSSFTFGSGSSGGLFGTGNVFGSSSGGLFGSLASPTSSGSGSSIFSSSSTPATIGFGGASSGGPTASPFAFGFGGSTASSTSIASAPGAAASTGFSFGTGASAGGGLGGAASGEVVFGSGASGFSIKLTPEKPSGQKEKALDSLPDFKRSDVPIGDVFVHGSGECDQLGLGDQQRERQKPTLVPGLVDKQICDVVVGSLHVLCLTTQGQVFSWGCNDDGALGRPAGDDDCEPRRAALPSGVVVRKITCGDNHSCVLDTLGRVWLWGTYKDSNGHIGIARKRKQTAVLEKSAEPAVVLDGGVTVVSGANHTIAVASHASGTKVFAWGSNGTGQLGLKGGPGCGLEERVVPSTGLQTKLASREGGGVEVDGLQVIRIKEASGSEVSAVNMKLLDIQQALTSGAAALVLEVPEREVPKHEKQSLLFPQEVHLADVEDPVAGAFASPECTFVTTTSGRTYGCGLNGDGQVGLGFASMAVWTLRPISKVENAAWLGGGLHVSAALVDGKVLTWGKAEECGHGIGPGTDPLMEPRVVGDLPKIRTLRCGNNHMLACSEGGDVFAWGCGLTHQLGNRPRSFLQPTDKDEDPEDELKPYRISSKQLEARFVLLADGGAQHSIELAWKGQYGHLSSSNEEALPLDATQQLVTPADDEEPPLKKVRQEHPVDVDPVLEAVPVPGAVPEAIAALGTSDSIPSVQPDSSTETTPKDVNLAGAGAPPSTVTQAFKFKLKDPLGIAFDSKLLVAKPVAEGSQAALVGICKGWHAVSLDGEKLTTAKQLVSKMKVLKSQGVEQVEIEFETDTPPPVPDNPKSQTEVSPPEVSKDTAVEDPVIPRVEGSEDVVPGGFSTLQLLAPADDRWKCDGCSLRWEQSLIKCKACESYKPGMSDADIAKAKASEEQKRNADIAIFRSPASAGTGFSTSAEPTATGLAVGAAAATTGGFSFGAGTTSTTSSGGFTFGAGTASTASSGGFTFGAGAASTASSGEFTFGAGTASTASPGGFTFGAGTSPTPSSAPGGFSFASKPGAQASGTVTFGSGSEGFTFTPVVTDAPTKEKALSKLPDFSRADVPVGDIFVHGSGECDQLGLGDSQRDRQKPTLVRGLSGTQICDVAVGAMHVLCVTSQGRIYSWGCNDDGALGREADADSDCLPRMALLPSGVLARRVSCGDCHSCALDNLGRVWLWGTYKDSNGHIGIARKRKQDAVFEKSAEPAVVLEGCTQISSGANHTVALAPATASRAQSVVFSWGSNGTGQLGLHSGAGCGLAEKALPAAEAITRLKIREGGGTEVDGLRVIRYVSKSGKEVDAMNMKEAEVQQAVTAGASEIVLEIPEREVAKAEKKALLFPQEMNLEGVDGAVSGVYTSKECTFVTVTEGRTYGCGLNGDGQVGLGFASMAVIKLSLVSGVSGALWLGGGLHTTAALVGGEVLTWGKADECGHGLSAGTPPLLEPRVVAGMPRIRRLRCGGNHMLACSEAGDVFVWGCGLTHQLANRPRDFSDSSDAQEDPDDELKPYRVSSKQLESRFVLLADGGAQHSVELAWSGGYECLSDTSIQSGSIEALPQVKDGVEEVGIKESPLKKARQASPESSISVPAPVSSPQDLNTDTPQDAARRVLKLNPAEPLGISFDKELVVAKPVAEGSQAAAAGICKGWRALSVDGEELKTTKQLVNKVKALKAKGLTQVEITFDTGETGKIVSASPIGEAQASPPETLKSSVAEDTTTPPTDRDATKLPIDGPPEATNAPADVAPDAAPGTFSTLHLLGAADDRWKCDGCSLRWDQSLIKCKACESYKPGMSEADIAQAKGLEEQKRNADIAIFRQSASADTGFSTSAAPQATGFSFGSSAPASTGAFSFGAEPLASAATGGFTFGGASSSPPASGGFTFGGENAPPTTSGMTTSTLGFGGMAASAPAGSPSTAGVSFGAPAADTSAPFSFGAQGVGTSTGFSFGAQGSPAAAPTPATTSFGFGTTATSAVPTSVTFGSGAVGFTFTPAAATSAPPKEKELSVLPDFLRSDVPVGDVFVHGSGECDQLGLGDNQRERQKPTLVRGLSDIQICDIAVGALHVLCLTSQGRIYSWGCNDDGALGRETDDSDCEPRLALLPAGVLARKVSCGDCHSCALDNLGRVWLWGTYKDSNGHIGIAGKRKQDAVFEKSAEPAVLLEGCTQISSGANHTVALAPAGKSRTSAAVFSWGSNGTGQLGLQNEAGCGLAEKKLPALEATSKLRLREGGGTEVDGLRLIRYIKSSGAEVDAMNMKLSEVQQALAVGVSEVVLEIPEREVPKKEKKALLYPQEMHLGTLTGSVSHVYTSQECTFVVVAEGCAYGCGLNGDGQVGLGFASMAVTTLRLLPGVVGAAWIGGGLHTSAALIGTKVFTWGKAEECGQGLGAGVEPILEPREITGMPQIRTVRCGGAHMLACSKSGDVFAWGCGLTHQLGNRPRDFSNPSDVDEDPDDELKPYRISSKQLESRFVLLADAGAQHSVELAWSGKYEELRDSAPLEILSESATQVQQPPLQEPDVQEAPLKKARAASPEKQKEDSSAESGAHVAPPEKQSEEMVAESSVVPPNQFATQLLAVADDRWKCAMCSLRWDQSLIKCKACDSYRPDMSEEDIAQAKAQEERKKDADVAKFRQSASTVAPTGFAFGASSNAGATDGFAFGGSASASGGFKFGAEPLKSASSTAAPIEFGFGGTSGNSAGAQATPPPSTGGFTFGGAIFGAQPAASTESSSAPVAFGFGNTIFSKSAESTPGSVPSALGAVTFGSGAGGFTFTPTAAVEPAKEKELSVLPEFTGLGAPVGEVFVHGSGECDQLGLGDSQRERQKPTLVRGLSGIQVHDIAVGALHVLCLTAQGKIYSWGCNDDGALGRETDDSDCEPRLALLPAGVIARKTSCGDCHSCALDNLGRVWLWGTYKDSNGHIGIARKRKQDSIFEKSAEPAVVLEGCAQISSGANHTVALAPGSEHRLTGVVFAWGSNGTGQLGLQSEAGCGFAEKVVPALEAQSKLKVREGGGTEVDGFQVIRYINSSGKHIDAMSLKLLELEQVMAAGATAVVLEIPEREVPKPEKKALLFPQEMHLEKVAGKLSGVYTSRECTFVTDAEGRTYGCGLNGDGQVGLGFASMAVTTLHAIPSIAGASWIGGGLHNSAALIGGKVFTWGKAEECGHGLGYGTEPLFQPREITGIPQIRMLRCGGNHTLACSTAGDVFAWGCGLTHQLGNRPRDFLHPSDVDEDPDDELRPYRISSKQLESRFVLLADGGAQHSVELAWSGAYEHLAEIAKVDDKPTAAPMQEIDIEEPAPKRSRILEDSSTLPSAIAQLQDRRLQDLFNQCDRNSDGRVSKIELIKVCASNPDIAELFHLPQKIRQEDGTRDEFERIFQGIDANEDRFIDWEEFRRFFAEYTKAKEPTTGSHTSLLGESCKSAAEYNAEAAVAEAEEESLGMALADAEVQELFQGGLYSDYDTIITANIFASSSQAQAARTSAHPSTTTTPMVSSQFWTSFSTPPSKVAAEHQSPDGEPRVLWSSVCPASTSSKAISDGSATSQAFCTADLRLPLLPVIPPEEAPVPAVDPAELRLRAQLASCGRAELEEILLGLAQRDETVRERILRSCHSIEDQEAEAGETQA